MAKEDLQRIDTNQLIKELLLPHCRLEYGDIWQDSARGHKVGCLDGSSEKDIQMLMGNAKSILAVQDPPYNVVVGNNNTQRLGQVAVADYIDWSRRGSKNTREE